MNDHCIRADSFILKLRNLRVYRITFSDGTTVLSPDREFAVQYLREIQATRLQADNKGR